jgi:hypothetical protein
MTTRIRIPAHLDPDFVDVSDLIIEEARPIRHLNGRHGVNSTRREDRQATLQRQAERRAKHHQAA